MKKLDEYIEALINKPTRPVVTLMLTATFCYGFIVGKVPVEAFVSAFSAVSAFWFLTRSLAQRPNGHDQPQEPPKSP